MNSRREILKLGAAAMLDVVVRHGSGQCHPSLGVPLGLQLFSLRNILPGDFAGTLREVHSLGYREVESAGYYNHSAAYVKQAMRGAGLRLVSAHHPFDDLRARLDEIMALNKDLGVRYIICPTLGVSSSTSARNRELKRPVTLDDWRWNAEQLNKFGESIKASGIQFGYHNHAAGFRPVDGVVPYIELLNRTDPAMVTMQLDCGWVVVGGGDPVELLRRYPERISSLHVKDFKRGGRPGDPPPAELGRGMIDNRSILLAAAKTGYVKHCFVEQEEYDMPPMMSLKVDAEYMRGLGACAD